MPEKDALIDFFENEEKYIDEIAAKCLSELTEEDKQVFREHPNPYEHHFWYGMYIRNKYFYENGLAIPALIADNMSSQILEKIIDMCLKEEKH